MKKIIYSLIIFSNLCCAMEPKGPKEPERSTSPSSEAHAVSAYLEWLDSDLDCCDEAGWSDAPRTLMKEPLDNRVPDSEDSEDSANDKANAVGKPKARSSDVIFLLLRAEGLKKDPSDIWPEHTSMDNYPNLPY